MRVYRVLRAVIVLCAATLTATAQGEWAQWGGPGRNFVVNTKGLAETWPEGGPRRLWARELGEGYSAIVVDKDTLFTMYGPAKNEEAVVAIAAATGKTVWEYKYAAPADGMNYQFGPGPHSTPLVAGGRVFAVGSTGKFHALDQKTGKVLWSHELWKDLGGTKLDRGYSCSPLAYKDTVILTVGGAGQTVVAFNQKDGKIAWKAQDLRVSPSSPMLINLDGQEQLVIFAGAAVAGLDPNNGALLWSHPHETQYFLNITMPVWGPDNILYLSSAYNGGSRALQLSRGKDGKTAVAELWFHRRMRVHHGTAIRVGDTVYGSSGDFGPAFVVAANVKTGDVLWQDRTFSKANFIYADGKFIILDEDGQLALATATPQGLKVLAKAEALKKVAWTVPALVGKRLYIRDRKEMAAIELP
jgi:outer membrane protein assembly factor BamB